MIMAGMLPGVESARRRRMRPSGTMGSQSGSRRSSFCLYATAGLEPHLSLNSLQRSGLSNGSELGNVAREAKERLDEKLRSQRTTTEIKRHNSVGDHGGDGAGSTIAGSVQREVYSKKACRKFSWTRMGRKALLEQKECAVCLDEFKAGDILMHLPCSHRFHWSCAAPWLETTSHCPCCRMALTQSCSSFSP